MQHPTIPLQSITDLRCKWDWSKVKVQLIPSIAGKHEGWPKVILAGHLRLMKALRDIGMRLSKGKELVLECQVRLRFHLVGLSLTKMFAINHRVRA
jgi:tyrosyl-DNA phosphodiesterase-1